MQADRGFLGSLVVAVGIHIYVLGATPPGIAGAADGPRAAIGKVADAVLHDFPKSPPFDWGEGVLMAGMMRAWQITGDDRYMHFVRRFGDDWTRQGIGPTLGQKGYCGHWGPGFAMLQLYEASGDARHLAPARQIIDFMQTKAERTQDGALSHFFGKPQLWVDTLAMCCPVYAHGSRLLGQTEWQIEAGRQLRLFCERLQDPGTGLFYHMWDEAGAQRTTALWARGNGWVLLSFVEVLKHEAPGSPWRARLEASFQKQAAGILKCQDAQTGMWHTVLDAPDTYPETSCTAMFLCGLAEASRQGWLRPSPAEPMRRAWEALLKQVDAQGRVIGVSAGTRPGDKTHYARVPTGSFTWGTGAFLLAASAYLELLQTN